MKLQSKRNERIYSLDSLRAIMMLLGIVLHSAISYQVYENSAWSLKDPLTHISNDYIVSFIHTFRMPIFFLIAGFFASLLFYIREPLQMIRNRFKRIVFPFLLSIFLLWPAVVFAFSYSRLVFEGDVNALEETISLFSNIFIFLPRHTFHLWFLYYLVFITSISIGLACFFKNFPSKMLFLMITLQ